MRKLSLIALLAVFLPLASYADSRVAVLDPLAAVVNTDYVQNRQHKLQDELKDKQAKAKKLAGELQGLQKNLQRNAATMSQEKKQDMQDDFTTKRMEFQSIQKLIKRRVQTDQRDVMQTIQPKFQQVLKQFVEDHDIDVVINAQAVMYVRPDIDITKAITAELNKLDIE